MTVMNEQRSWNIPLPNDLDKRNSELCKAKDFYRDWYKRWCTEIGEPPRFHRKQWEFVYIMQALWERGCLQEGKRGLVFAVGSEPLPAVFANYGCNILATDIFPDDGISKGWNNDNQLCFGLDSLYKSAICDRQTFDNRVEYQAVDMNNIPADLRNFDFNWSSCSFEHLGTIEKGFSFLKNQLKTLKNRGWAVHTTEYNITSNHETQDNNDTVIYRQRDINKIVSDLKKEGHLVEELDFSLGGLPEDFQVDIEPHLQDVHLKLQIGNYVATSFGLIIQKNGNHPSL